MSLQQPGVGPIARQRTRLSGRQKIGIFIILAVVGAAFVILARVFTGSTKHEETTPPNNFAASAGIPYSPPLQPEVAKPVSMSFPPPQVVAAKPISAAVTPTAPTKDPDADSPIFAEQGVGGYETGTAVRHASGNEGGAKDNLSAALVHSDLGPAARAMRMPHPALTIPAGTVIPCILQTAINSQLAGFVDCTIPSEVRGATGTVTLLDRGTQVFGEIKSGLRQGQNRLFILWVRARTPDNVVVTFDSPAADELGRAGVSGYVNDHFWSRFGAALLYSLLDYGPQLATAAIQNGNGNSYVTFLSPQQQLANTILQDQLNIPPNLEKNQGDTVSIFVARDVDFSGVYDLEATTP